MRRDSTTNPRFLSRKNEDVSAMNAAIHPIYYRGEYHRFCKKFGRPGPYRNQHITPHRSTQEMKQKCPHCGYDHERRYKFPGRGQICDYCKKRSLFAAYLFFRMQKIKEKNYLSHCSRRRLTTAISRTRASTRRNR